MKKVLIMLMMSTLILSGCTTTRNTEDNFIVGMEAAYQPFNWQAIKRGSSGVYLDGGAGIADGYDVVIASKIAKKIHRKLVIKKSAGKVFLVHLNQEKSMRLSPE